MYYTARNFSANEVSAYGLETEEEDNKDGEDKNPPLLDTPY